MIWYYIMLCYVILYYIMLYYIMLYYIILYCWRALVRAGSRWEPDGTWNENKEECNSEAVGPYGLKNMKQSLAKLLCKTQESP